MDYEIDFLAVGEGERSGDAIALRYGNLRGPREQQFVMVIDGGTLDSGQALVDHISHIYGTNHVDLVVSGHPDADHASGLSVVLEKMTVGRLWMHQPWKHAKEIMDMFENERITHTGLKTTFQEALEHARELEMIAAKKRIQIQEPFSDVNMGYSHISVLGPSTDFYESLLPRFREVPEPKQGLARIAEALYGGVGVITEKAKQVMESWGLETLEEPGDGSTSAENDSSTILLLQIDGKGILFTGDAGISALNLAAGHAESLGISLPESLEFCQVPHHGSRRNVGPGILDRILGLRKSSEIYPKTAFVSSAKDSDKHPSKRVVNAFKRRGAQVYATQGKGLCHSSHGISRQGWSGATPLPFYAKVEEEN